MLLIRVLKWVSVFVLLSVVPVQAQQSGYYIDPDFVGSWTPYPIVDTALAPLLILRSDGKLIMYLNEVHTSFSGDKREPVVVAGTWRVLGGVVKQICLAPPDGENVSCYDAVMVGNLLIMHGYGMWTLVGRKAAEVKPPPVHSGHSSRATKLPSRLSFGITRSQDSALAKLDQVQLPPFSTSTASPRSPTPPPSLPDTRTYYEEYQVEKPALSREGNPRPVYPPKLDSAHIEGEVLVQFVIDTTGRVDMSTFKVLMSSNDLFTQSVENIMPKMRFYPAETGGHKVKEVVQFPFSFAKPHD